MQYKCAVCEHVCKYVHFVTRKAFIALLGLHISFNLVNNIGLCLFLFYIKISHSQYEGISFKSDNVSSLVNNKIDKITEYLIINPSLHLQLLKLPEKETGIFRCCLDPEVIFCKGF